MGHQRADESEHRRGLVLGLTLAEVLLLLLFVLLLAMSSKLADLQKPAPLSPSVVTIVGPVVATPNIGDDVGGTPLETGSLGNDVAQRDVLSVALDDLRKAAAEFDPNDQPAVLKRIEGLIRVLPRNGSTLADIQKVVQDLEARKPGTSMDELKRAVAILERLPSNATADDVIMRPEPTAKESGDKHPDWPPIITLSEADGFYFPSGSAELAPQQRDKLSGPVVDALVKIIDQYSDVNVIEVIGHTDEQPIETRPSNLDGSLFARVQGAPDRPEMISADNAGLGLARAVAVAEVLLQRKRLTKFRILPLSGAQLIDLDDDLSKGTGPRDVEKRRRIEIRVRQSERGATVGTYERKPLATAQPKKKPKDNETEDWNPFIWKF